MKNTTKHAGVVAAVLTAAGIAGACPGTAFADTAPAGHLPTGGSPLGGVSQNVGSDRGGERPIVVHGPISHRSPILDGGPILDRGPGWHGDHDGRGRGDHDRDDRGWRGDHDRDDRGWRGDHHRPIVIHGPYRGYDDDDAVILESTPVLQVDQDPAAWVSQTQTGTICSVGGGNIVVTGADGTTWTWSTGTTTTVRVVGVVRTLADLRVGERITITGLINGTARHAQTVVAVSEPQTEVVTVTHPASFVTFGHTHFLRRHDRDDRCERVIGHHRRGGDCDHEHGDHHRGGRGGRHRL